MTFLIDRRRMASLILCAFGVALSTRFVMAQDTKPLPKVFEQKVQLQLAAAQTSAAIATITKTAHVNILADGEPILLKADLKFDGTLHEALDKIADTFDYTWTVSKSGSVLMSKRFKNPNERPQTNSPEMTRMAHDIINALSLVEFDKDTDHWNHLITQIGRSLTLAQTQMLSSARGLLGSDLTPVQQQLLQQAMLVVTLKRPLLMWESALANLEGMDASAITTRKHPVIPGDVYNRIFDYIYSFHALDGSEHSVGFPSIVYQSDATGTVVTP